jgi:type I pantothenate kinase
MDATEGGQKMSSVPIGEAPFSRHINFTREEWAQRREYTPLTLSEERLAALRSLNDRISLDEVEQIYLPLSRLLDLYINGTQKLHTVTSTFLGHKEAKVPYVIGIAGSVAVGKSTTARLIQELLGAWPSAPRVDLITTDGFLYPNKTLQARGIMNRKGFPESYNVRRLIRFLAEVKAGQPAVSAPLYSHLIYDIVPNELQIVQQPDILIVEGLNILQENARKGQHLFVSDFFDFTIYVDADEDDIEQWYMERFFMLRETAFRDPSSYFRRYAEISTEEAIETAKGIWNEINGPNLHENILPTRERAHLILKKDEHHLVQKIKLRKL